MSTVVKSAQTKAVAPIDHLRMEMSKMLPQFQMALPENVTPEKFLRVVLNTVLSNPDFLKCDRTSLYSAAMKCAADGLLPDGREAAMIPYGNICQYQPMIAGIYKKARNSGEISILCADIVFPEDKFQYGTNSERGRYLDHVPGEGGERKHTEAVKVFALSKTKDGDIDFEVMTRSEIEFVRSKAKSANSPAWRDWWGEMAKKVVVKRLAKRLPTSADVQKLIDRDNDEDFELHGNTKSKTEELSDRLALGNFGGSHGEPVPEQPQSDDPNAFSNFENGPAIETTGKTVEDPKLVK